MNPTADLFYRASRTYRGWRVVEVVVFLWSDQVDAAARVGEDEICDGGGDRARATEEQREEEDDWKEENGKT